MPSEPQIVKNQIFLTTSVLTDNVSRISVRKILLVRTKFSALLDRLLTHR